MRNVRRCWHFCVFEIFCEVLLSWWKIFELLPAASLRYFDGGSSLLRKCAGFSSTIPLTIIFHSKKCCDPFISYRENLLHISVQCQTDDFILGSLSSGPTVICFLIHPDRCPVFCLSVTRFPFLWVRPVILIVAENPAGINFACNSRLFVHGAQRGGKHAMEHFWWKFQSNFEIVLNGIQREGSQRPDVEARRKFSCRAASTSPGRQSCLCSDDSHSAETRTRARDTHEVWSNTWVECELDLSTCSSQFHLSTDDSHQPHRHVRNHAEIVTLGLDRVRTKHLLHVELEYAHTCSLCKLHIAPRLLGSVCLCLTNCARSWRRLGRNPPKATTSSRTTVLTSTTQQTKIPKGMICTNMIKFSSLPSACVSFWLFVSPLERKLRCQGTSAHLAQSYTLSFSPTFFWWCCWATSAHTTIRFPVFLEGSWPFHFLSVGPGFCQMSLDHCWVFYSHCHVSHLSLSLSCPSSVLSHHFLPVMEQCHGGPNKARWSMSCPSDRLLNPSYTTPENDTVNWFDSRITIWFYDNQLCCPKIFWPVNRVTISGRIRKGCRGWACAWTLWMSGEQCSQSHRKVRFPFFFFELVERNSVLYKAFQTNKTAGVSSRNHTMTKIEIMHMNLRFRVWLDFSIGWRILISWNSQTLLSSNLFVLDICIKVPASTTECLLFWFWFVSKLRNFEFLEKGWNIVLFFKFDKIFEGRSESEMRWFADCWSDGSQQNDKSKVNWGTGIIRSNTQKKGTKHCQSGTRATLGTFSSHLTVPSASRRLPIFFLVPTRTPEPRRPSEQKSEWWARLTSTRVRDSLLRKMHARLQTDWRLDLTEDLTGATPPLNGSVWCLWKLKLLQNRDSLTQSERLTISRELKFGIATLSFHRYELSWSSEGSLWQNFHQWSTKEGDIIRWRDAGVWDDFGVNGWTSDGNYDDSCRIRVLDEWNECGKMSAKQKNCVAANAHDACGSHEVWTDDKIVVNSGRICWRHDGNWRSVIIRRREEGGWETILSAHDHFFWTTFPCGTPSGDRTLWILCVGVRIVWEASDTSPQL